MQKTKSEQLAEIKNKFYAVDLRCESTFLKWHRFEFQMRGDWSSEDEADSRYDSFCGTVFSPRSSRGTIR